MAALAVRHECQAKIFTETPKAVLAKVTLFLGPFLTPDFALVNKHCSQVARLSFSAAGEAEEYGKKMIAAFKRGYEVVIDKDRLQQITHAQYIVLAQGPEDKRAEVCKELGLKKNQFDTLAHFIPKFIGIQGIGQVDNVIDISSYNWIYSNPQVKDPPTVDFAEFAVSTHVKAALIRKSDNTKVIRVHNISDNQCWEIGNIQREFRSGTYSPICIIPPEFEGDPFILPYADHNWMVVTGPNEADRHLMPIFPKEVMNEILKILPGLNFDKFFMDRPSYTNSHIVVSLCKWDRSNGDKMIILLCLNRKDLKATPIVLYVGEGNPARRIGIYYNKALFHDGYRLFSFTLPKSQWKEEAAVSIESRMESAIRAEICSEKIAKNFECRSEIQYISNVFVLVRSIYNKFGRTHSKIYVYEPSEERILLSIQVPVLNANADFFDYFAWMKFTHKFKVFGGSAHKGDALSSNWCFTFFDNANTQVYVTQEKNRNPASNEAEAKEAAIVKGNQVTVTSLRTEKIYQMLLMDDGVGALTSKGLVKFI